MQKEGPGEMASSLKSESMFLVHIGSRGLFSAVHAEGADAGQCCHYLQAQESDKGEWRGFTFVSSTMPFSSFPGLQWNL